MATDGFSLLQILTIYENMPQVARSDFCYSTPRSSMKICGWQSQYALRSLPALARAWEWSKGVAKFEEKRRYRLHSISILSEIY
jgi:hypothetical protein